MNLYCSLKTIASKFPFPAFVGTQTLILQMPRPGFLTIRSNYKSLYELNKYHLGVGWSRLSLSVSRVPALGAHKVASWPKQANKHPSAQTKLHIAAKFELQLKFLFQKPNCIKNIKLGNQTTSHENKNNFHFYDPFTIRCFCFCPICRSKIF